MQGMHAVGIQSIHHHLACGGKMLLDTNDQIAQRIRCEDAFEPQVRAEFERIAGRKVNIIDIGANVGYYSILGGKLIGPEKRLFSFEPQPRMIDRLRRNVALSSLENVQVFPIALSDSTGSVTFYVPPEGRESMGSMRANGRFDISGTIQVNSQRLDDVLQDLGNPKIGLIKMDAEGAELQILRGATDLLSSSDKPDLIFEGNEKNCRAFGYCVFDLLQFVGSFGYKLRQLDYEDWLAEA